MIRLAKESDIKSILNLLQQVANVHHDIRPDLFKQNAVKYDTKELESMIEDPDNTPIFVYVKGTEVLGYAICMREEYRNHGALQSFNSIYIDDICVDENQRGNGIGSALYDYVVRFAYETGCHNITLNVWQGNDAAMAFYKKMGMHIQKTCMEIIIK